MLPLALALLLLAADEEKLPWPLQDGKTPIAVIQRYGQLQQAGEPLHLGVDLQARAGESVYSVQSGIVKKVVDNGDTGVRVVIKSDSSWAFAYTHLKPESLQVLVGVGSNGSPNLGILTACYFP